ncbi:hypothetical protein F5J12DRAFT_784828 [Pisolithus orientalis]|uniref:uncharacterized protein n=1 Tax=Pisolithus orientalis TaxID=936130 RepID=UPI002224942C|nr:uncharacterized protein F5J12DRAFT_784828 [Pisolithus orientalis]KAI5998989.1 hypothetical protein F5J12DRAFT_784828 [Pisolithus orientalis]
MSTRMATASINVSTIQCVNGIGLGPVNCSISFDGHLNIVDALPCIPMQISIHVPEEYSHLRPSLHTSDAMPHTPLQPLSHTNFPYLPLSPTFNHLNGAAWTSLTDEIQFWLVHSITEKHSPNWLWSWEFFWMAFIAAFPQFPHNVWLTWNPLVPMEGLFICNWVSELNSAYKHKDCGDRNLRHH